MHDVDLKGKTTTYFKDILHRFIKNKISVFGFIIIALIIWDLLSSLSLCLSTTLLVLMLVKLAWLPNSSLRELDGGMDVFGKTIISTTLK